MKVQIRDAFNHLRVFQFDLFEVVFTSVQASSEWSNMS